MRFEKGLTKELRHWLKDNGFAVGCRWGKEWAFEPEENYITIPKVYDSDSDDDFIHFLRSNGLANDFDCITLSMLHEIGHFETMPYFTNEEWENDALVKCVYELSETDYSEYLYKYWNTQTEYSANMWAIMYVKAFSSKVEELEDIFGNYLKW